MRPKSGAGEKPIRTTLRPVPSDDPVERRGAIAVARLMWTAFQLVAAIPRIKHSAPTAPTLLFASTVEIRTQGSGSCVRSQQCF